MLTRQTWRSIGVWALRFAEFGAVQAVVQVLNAVSGLIIVRSLPKSEYAYFAIANGMQSACSLLADLGIGIGVSSIGGRVWNQRRRFGALLNTALFLRRRFAIASFAVCIPLTAWLLWSNDAPAWLVAGLCITVGAATLPVLSGSVFGAGLQLHGELRRIQKLDTGCAALRLAAMCVLWLTWINALLAAMVGAALNWLHLRFVRRWTARHAAPDAPVDASDRSELMRLSRKSSLNAAFFCLQGQLTIMILTLFGTTAAVADITALGRLAVIFTVFGATFSTVVMPRFARCQEPQRLATLYVSLVGMTALLFTPLALAAWLMPEPFLWLLGEKYEALAAELGWVATTACVTQLAGTMWVLNASKAWIRVQAPGFIPAILVAQVAALCFLDVREFRDVLVFNVVTAVAPLPIYAADAWLGLRAYRNAALVPAATEGA